MKFAYPHVCVRGVLVPTHARAMAECVRGRVVRVYASLVAFWRTHLLMHPNVVVVVICPCCFFFAFLDIRVGISYIRSTTRICIGLFRCFVAHHVSIIFAFRLFSWLRRAGRFFRLSSRSSQPPQALA